MKNFYYLLFITVTLIACDSKDSPTSGSIQLTQGKKDTLSTNINQIVKDSIRAGVVGIYGFELDSIYNLQWIPKADTLPKEAVQSVNFDYHGNNVASRKVRRKAAAYLNDDLTVLGYKDLIYLDQMEKDSIKNSRRTAE